MGSLSKTINAFELAIVLSKASNKPEELATNVDLTKLTRLINAHFAPEEKVNAGTSRVGQPQGITGTTSFEPVH